MKWDLVLAPSARKSLQRAPDRDRQRILTALEAMRENPYSGDVARLQNRPATWRRSVGDWRVFFNVRRDRQLIEVPAIARRTSTTY